ncbi:PIN domain-containing protein [Mycena alexandri]|uniref:PIN domain-containing protein n=1 Tax=Mycena alexandri TaxID=1745969 RepID=A0AAD6TII5_9AGAR|nr:PIN domain-containing protein [Mycena alexandri]
MSLAFASRSPIPPPLAHTNSFHAPTPHYGDVQAPLHNATLQQIDQLLQDVEMQAPVDDSTTCLVVDTNILLGNLRLLQQFVSDVEAAAVSIIVIIPGAVVNELDGQKKSDRLGWFSRRASAWLLEKVKQKRSVRGQGNAETMNPSGNWRTRQRGQPFGERYNDELILDCCLYFRSKFRTALFSADTNLRIESESQGVRSIAPTSGRDLAQFLLGRDLEKFQPYEADYTGIDSLEHDNSMDVDEEAPRLSAEQAMDLLHVQVIEHFTRLLVALVGRVGPELEDVASDGGVTASQHAPKWKNGDKPYREWNAAECLEYLDRKRRAKRTDNPRLEVFLSKPYSSPGARKGREWSYEAWSSALHGLGQVGDDWGDLSIRQDLDELTQHREAVFGLRK